MKPPIASLLALTVLACALPTFGQSLSIGTNFSTTPLLTDLGAGSVRTDIDIGRFATATGTVTTVRLYWSGCSGPLKIKFFRRTGDTLATLDERGPFFVSPGETILTISPMTVLQGDLIGTTSATGCGSPGILPSSKSGGYLQYFSDPPTGTSLPVAGGARYFNTLAIFGSGPAIESVAAVLPVIGSAPGVAGSHFTTSLQLLNPDSGNPAITGRLVLHRINVPGSASDASVPYTIAPGGVLSVSDLMALFGAPGVGSVDVIVPAGGRVPYLSTRVYNDAGPAGTAGFSEDAVPAVFPGTFGSRLLSGGTTGVLITPIDPSRTRFNIGIRTFYAGARVTAILVRPEGGTITSVIDRRYPANTLVQTDAASFFGVPIGANQSIIITVGDGDAIVYGTTNDNVTNDPSIQVAYVFASS
jgi:hypothetical protein